MLSKQSVASTNLNTAFYQCRNMQKSDPVYILIANCLRVFHSLLLRKLTDNTTPDNFTFTVTQVYLFPRRMFSRLPSSKFQRFDLKCKKIPWNLSFSHGKIVS